MYWKRLRRSLRRSCPGKTRTKKPISRLAKVESPIRSKRLFLSVHNRIDKPLTYNTRTREQLKAEEHGAKTVCPVLFGAKQRFYDPSATSCFTLARISSSVLVRSTGFPNGCGTSIPVGQ